MTMTGIGPGAAVRVTERMTLRRLDEADAPEFVRVLGLSRGAWAPYTPANDAALNDSDLFRLELMRAVSGAKAGTHVRLGGFSRDGVLIGLFALNEIVRGVFKSAHASWQVSADRMGQGYGTEGVTALIDLAFDAQPAGLGLHRVQANIMPGNAASLRIAEKVGLRREGLALRYLEIAGRWEDHVMFAITSEERPHAESSRRGF